MPSLRTLAKLKALKLTLGQFIYLGAYLGLGNLSHLNFERPLKNAQNNMQGWNKRHLTLPARVVVAKTFIASLFVHIVNSVHIHTHQIQIIQNLLNDFLWHGKP